MFSRVHELLVVALSIYPRPRPGSKGGHRDSGFLCKLLCKCATPPLHRKPLACTECYCCTVFLNQAQTATAPLFPASITVHVRRDCPTDHRDQYKARTAGLQATPGKA